MYLRLKYSDSAMKKAAVPGTRTFRNPIRGYLNQRKAANMARMSENVNRNNLKLSDGPLTSGDPNSDEVRDWTMDDFGFDKEDRFMKNVTSQADETQSMLDSSMELKNSVLQLTNTLETNLNMDDAALELGSCVSDGEKCLFNGCFCKANTLKDTFDLNLESELDDYIDMKALDLLHDEVEDSQSSTSQGKEISKSQGVLDMVGESSESDSSGSSSTSNSESKKDTSDWFTAPNTPLNSKSIESSADSTDGTCTDVTSFESLDSTHSPKDSLTALSSEQDEEDTSESSCDGTNKSSGACSQTATETVQQEANVTQERFPKTGHGTGGHDKGDGDRSSDKGNKKCKEKNGEDNCVASVSEDNFPHSQQTILLPQPPIILASSLQYEIDPDTQKAKSIGKGSFGQVFKAQFANPDFRHYPIVVKEFDAEFTNSREICEECQRLIYLKDTGYVPVCYGLVPFGDAESHVYGIVQEYVGTGLTLEMFLWDQSEMHSLSWINVVRQCCEGLARFHEKGILLNDIKTNNILLDYQDEVVLIKYIDFGLATGLKGKRFKNSKSLEQFSYLAPEIRLKGEKTTLASDVYSLGYMLEQIQSYADIGDMKWITELCMKDDPRDRVTARHATTLVENLLRFLTYGQDVPYGRIAYVDPPKLRRYSQS